MTKQERVFAALAGEPVDRPPASFWRHFYPEEVTADGLASVMLGFQKEFDWDFVKVNARAMYHSEDWGNRYDFSTDPDKNHEQTSHRVQEPGDWRNLEPLDPNEGTLGQHLAALRQIGEGLGGEVPYIMTIFNPISIAGQLTGGEKKLMEHIRSDAEAVHAGLQIITESYIRFARACLDAGTTGIFFPTTLYASSDLMTAEEYSQFGRPYDLQFLEQVQDARFLMLHVCKSNCYLRQLLDYPVHAVNWSTQDPTTPSLAEIAEVTSLTLVGGIDQGETVTSPGPEKALQQAREARSAAGGKPFILGAGCTVPHNVNYETLRAVRELVEELAQIP